jgi:glycosyltransferase involved in cell wall biosynthesis
MKFRDSAVNNRILMLDSYFDSLYGAQKSMLVLAKGISFAADPIIFSLRAGRLVDAAKDLGLATCIIGSGGERAPVTYGKLISSGSYFSALTSYISDVRRAYALTRVMRIQKLYANDIIAALILIPISLLRSIDLYWYVRGNYTSQSRLATLMHIIGVIFSKRIFLISNGVKSAFPSWVLSRYREKIVVLYIGIRAEEYFARDKARCRAVVRAAYGIDALDRLVVCVGSINPRKGQDLLVDAIDVIQREGLQSNYKVIIAGSPEGEYSMEYCVKLRRRADDAKLPIIFIDYGADIPVLLAAADIFVLPSREEAFGRATLEAMAAMLPCVITRAGGNEELVSHEVSGLVVPQESERIAEALSLLLNNPEIRRSYGSAGLQIALNRFSVDRYAEGFLRNL